MVDRPMDGAHPPNDVIAGSYGPASGRLRHLALCPRHHMPAQLEAASAVYDQQRQPTAPPTLTTAHTAIVRSWQPPPEGLTPTPSPLHPHVHTPAPLNPHPPEMKKDAAGPRPHPRLHLHPQEVASTCGVRAMPTFMGFFGGQKVGEVVGVNQSGLRALAEE